MAAAASLMETDHVTASSNCRRQVSCEVQPGALTKRAEKDGNDEEGQLMYLITKLLFAQQPAYLYAAAPC